MLDQEEAFMDPNNKTIQSVNLADVKFWGYCPGPGPYLLSNMSRNVSYGSWHYQPQLTDASLNVIFVLIDAMTS